MKMTNHIIYLQETYQMEECPQCRGAGQLEYDVPKPHAGGFNEGYIDTEWGDCELCEGRGEVIKPCPACGEDMSLWDTMHGIVCQACQEEEA